MIRSLVLIFFLSLSSFLVTAQDLPLLRRYIDTLCSGYFAGRGYTEQAALKTATYLEQEFQAMGLAKFQNSFQQHYDFPVNTFPGDMELVLNGKKLQPGTGYLLHPASSGARFSNRKIIPVDLHQASNFDDWQALLRKMAAKPGKAYLLLHMDSLEKKTGKNREVLVRNLGKGIYLLPERSKPLWSVARDTMPATFISLYDTAALAATDNRLSGNIAHVFIPGYPVANLIGYVPGREQPDSFIVITAHFDHLGKMGKETMFPGASDNASGTAMALTLARFYALHPGRYSIAFMLFSGEEAGLIGSFYYTKHPLFPLKQIRFLLNLDILGDASTGITMVNGSAYSDAFQKLKDLNFMDGDEKGGRRYLPEIRMRGQAAISDHYAFSLAGVPAFYIYSEGGKGFYHDIRDNASSLSLENIPALSTLLKQFVGVLQKGN
jgi:aminopeptidase YwaD